MKNILSALALTSMALVCLPAQAADTIVKCGATIDVVSKKLTGPRSFVITEQKISSGPAGAAAKMIDLSDSTCLPGLIDMHVHLTGQSSPRSYIEQFTLNVADTALTAAFYADITLQAGFTTVRNLGDDGSVTVSLRNAIASGKAVGPRILQRLNH